VSAVLLPQSLSTISDAARGPAGRSPTETDVTDESPLLKLGLDHLNDMQCYYTDIRSPFSFRESNRFGDVLSDNI